MQTPRKSAKVVSGGGATALFSTSGYEALLARMEKVKY